MRYFFLAIGVISVGFIFIYQKKILATRHPQSFAAQVNDHTRAIYKSGDIIFQTSRSDQSKAIQQATHSKYSHMGILYEVDGQFFVYEAIQPVTLTPLAHWIKRGEGGRYVIKRLKNHDEIVTPENVKRMKDFGEKFKGKGYDIYFEWSDDKIYCSELVWKVYKGTLGIEIGSLQELREFDLSSEIVKNKMRERYGNNIPLSEKVISPSAMFQSDKLITVEMN
jgi:uncharacterized protein YycO